MAIYMTARSLFKFHLQASHTLHNAAITTATICLSEAQPNILYITSHLLAETQSDCQEPHALATMLPQ